MLPLLELNSETNLYFNAILIATSTKLPWMWVNRVLDPVKL